MRYYGAGGYEHIAKGGQVCSHDGPHALEVVVEFITWGEDGIVTRAYVVDEGVDPNSGLPAGIE